MGKIEIRGLSKAFGEKRVLEDVSLVLPEDSVTAILAPSGFGKNQLLFVKKSLNTPSPNQARSPKEVEIRWRNLQKELKSQSRFYFLQSSVNDGAASARVMQPT